MVGRLHPCGSREESELNEQNEEGKLVRLFGARQIALTKAQQVQTSNTNVSN
jgi:hypothetical protein